MCALRPITRKVTGKSRNKPIFCQSQIAVHILPSKFLREAPGLRCGFSPRARSLREPVQQRRAHSGRRCAPNSVRPPVGSNWRHTIARRCTYERYLFRCLEGSCARLLRQPHRKPLKCAWDSSSARFEERRGIPLLWSMCQFRVFYRPIEQNVHARVKLLQLPFHSEPKLLSSRLWGATPERPYAIIVISAQL
jgi:hypothetical protein